MAIALCTIGTTFARIGAGVRKFGRSFGRFRFPRLTESVFLGNFGRCPALTLPPNEPFEMPKYIRALSGFPYLRGSRPSGCLCSTLRLSQVSDQIGIEFGRNSGNKRRSCLVCNSPAVIRK